MLMIAAYDGLIACKELKERYVGAAVHGFLDVAELHSCRASRPPFLSLIRVFVEMQFDHEILVYIYIHIFRLLNRTFRKLFFAGTCQLYKFHFEKN